MALLASADQYGGQTKNDRSAVRGKVAHARRRHSADEYGKAAERDQIRRSDAHRHVGDAGGRQAADQYGRSPEHDGSADMRYEDGDHRTDMHVRHARSRHSHGYSPGG